MNVEVFCFDAVAPVRERGLKFSRPITKNATNSVAPVRERGLKYLVCASIPTYRQSLP